MYRINFQSHLKNVTDKRMRPSYDGTSQKCTNIYKFFGVTVYVQSTFATVKLYFKEHHSLMEK